MLYIAFYIALHTYTHTYIHTCFTNMLYIAYFIIVSGHNIKKMFCKIFYF